MTHHYVNEPAVASRTDHDASEGAKTSAAAAFALVFGLSGLLSVLTIILGPLGLALGIIGIVLGVLGIRNAGTPGVTGKGVAIAGLVLSILAVAIGGALTLGATFFLNREDALDRLEQELSTQLEQLRQGLPEDAQSSTSG